MPLDGVEDDDAHALADALADFPTFCSFLDIRLKDAPPKRFAYDEWFHEQQVFEANRTGLDIVLKPRQVGFSTLELARDLWFALMHPGVNVLVVAHDGDLAEQLFQTLHIFCRSLREHTPCLLPPTRYSSKREVVFADTNSAVRIVEAGATEAAAKKKGRSGHIHRLHVTEQAFWGAAADTMAALTGSSDGAEKVIESTANGAGGLYYENVVAARAGTSGWKLHFFAWYGHAEYRLPVPHGFDPAPRDEWEERLREAGCDDQHIAWWRSKVDDPNIGLELALQEYPVDIDTCFRAAGRTWLDAVHLDAMARWVRPPSRKAPIAWNGNRFPDANIYAEPVHGRHYVVFGDVAEGVARDGSAACVMDAESTEVVATWWSDSVDPSDFGLVLAVLGWLYGTALVGVERNNHGHATLGALSREVQYPKLYRAKDAKLGWDTNSATRPVLWEDLAFAIRDGSAKTPDGETIAECKTVIRDDDGKPRARGKGSKSKDSSRDDRFVAWAGCLQIRTSAMQRRGSFHIPGL